MSLILDFGSISKCALDMCVLTFFVFRLTFPCSASADLEVIFLLFVILQLNWKLYVVTIWFGGYMILFVVYGCIYYIFCMR